MNTRPFAARLQCWLGCAFALQATLAFAANSIDSNLTKSFSVKPGGELVIDADSGSINIATSESTEVVVDVKRRVTGANDAEAQTIFKAHEVSFDRDGDQIRVTARFNQDANRLLRRGKVNFQVNYEVRLPRQFSLNLRTGAGAIDVAAIEGTVKARTSGGNLKFDAIKGSLEADTAAGGVSAAAVSGVAVVKSSGGNLSLGELGADVTATTAAGSIKVRSVQGKLTAKSNGGNFDVGEVVGPAEISTAAGSISVKVAKDKLVAKSNGGNLNFGELAGPADVSTAAGSIRVKVASAGLVAKTSGGTIHIEDARATVQAKTAAGSITANFSAQPKEDCRLATAGGNIEVRVAENVAFDLNAHTSGGRVSTDLPASTLTVGKRQGDTLQGKLNGGGKELALQTSAGNITLKK